MQVRKCSKPGDVSGLDPANFKRGQCPSSSSQVARTAKLDSPLARLSCGWRSLRPWWRFVQGEQMTVAVNGKVAAASLTGTTNW